MEEKGVRKSAFGHVIDSETLCLPESLVLFFWGSLVCLLLFKTEYHFVAQAGPELTLYFSL